MDIKHVLRVEIVNVLEWHQRPGETRGNKAGKGLRGEPEDAILTLSLVESRCGKIGVPFRPWVGDARVGSEFRGRYYNGIGGDA